MNFSILLIFALLSVAAGQDSGDLGSGGEQPPSTCVGRAVLESATFDLIVGNPKNERVVGGTVSIEVAGNDVTVTVDGNDEWDVKHVHVFVGDAWPFAGEAPAPGSFGVNEAVTSLPFSTTFTVGEGELANVCDTVALAVHTESVGRGEDNDGQSETGWADGGKQFDGSRWGFYHEACVEGCVPEEVPPGAEEEVPPGAEQGNDRAANARRMLLERFNRRANGMKSDDETDGDSETEKTVKSESEGSGGDSESDGMGKPEKPLKVRQIVIKGNARAEEVREAVEKVLGRMLGRVEKNADGSIVIEFPDNEELTPEQAGLVAAAILDEVELVTDIEPVLADAVAEIQDMNDSASKFITMSSAAALVVVAIVF